MTKYLSSSDMVVKAAHHAPLGTAVTLAMVFFCSSLYAQTLLSTIRGTVTDVTGAVAANVQVTITDVKTDLKVRTLASDSNGNYEAPDLVPGIYRVIAEAPGFKSY